MPDRATFQVRARQAVVPLLVFAVARGLQMVVMYFVLLLDRAQTPVGIMSRWDGVWYLSVAANGYPSELVAGEGNAAQSTLGFFPAYPMLMTFVERITPLGLIESAVFVSLVCGAAAMVAIWFLTRRLCDQDTATRTVVLLSFAPSAFVFGMAYSEALLLLLAAVCLWALVTERWLLAGVAAGIASASRPNGFVLGACCAWAAFLAFRRTRSVRPFVAPLLAPSGLLAFVAFLWVRTGDPAAYVKTQARGWGQGFDAGISTTRKLLGVLVHPLDDFNLLSCFIAVVVVAIAAVYMWRWRPPFIFVIFTVGILGLALTSTSLTSTGRFVMTAFPLTIAIARGVRGEAFAVLAAGSATVMSGLFVLASLSLYYAP